MSFFNYYFKNFSDYEEVHICCPFPHHTENGEAYSEEVPSASFNQKKRLFHCQVCGTGLTEVQFIQKVLSCTTPQAYKLEACFNDEEATLDWWSSQKLHDTGKEVCQAVGIDMPTAVKLKIKSKEHDPDSIFFPVTFMGHVVDLRQYTPNGTPKVKSLKGAPAGLVIPESVFDNKKVIWMCEGEKDMAHMIQNSLNGCCLTGGAGATPLYLKPFVDRKIAIVYDNDDAGRNGAEALANILVDIAASVKVIDISKVCTEVKEDITDFFDKYGKTKDDLIDMYKNTADWIKTEKLGKHSRRYVSMPIKDAIKVDNINKMVRSVVQVNGVNDEAYAVPSYIQIVKVAEGSGDLDVNEQLDWQLTEETLRDLIGITGVAVGDNSLRDKYKELCGVLHTEKNVAVKVGEMVNVYVANVMDVGTDNPTEITLYSIGKKLESGHKYLITHKVVTSPNKAGLLLSVATDASEAADTVDTFKITDDVKANLDAFRELGADVSDRFTCLTEKVKGLLGYNGNSQLIATIDLAFHTPLYFNFGRFKNVRAYLDTLVVGESRVGKSSTAEVLLKTYGLGTFVSLAGNSATVPALCGGTNKVNNMNQTKAGVIPMNHKGLIVFEEFGKCANNITSELTDIRSSNEVRINRVSGSLTLPAMVRMISLSNVKPTSNGDIRPIASYPNGIAICTELVPTAEDIARYDMVLISAYKGENQIDPFWEPETPMTEDQYRDRIRWVWSRKPEQIIFAEGAVDLIRDWCNELNKNYDCHIKIFGTETWKKLSRLAIALAGYTVSTDETYENIVVTKECVSEAAAFLTLLYDNDTFRFKEYCDNERRYNTIDKNGIELLGELWFKAPSMLMHLDEEPNPTKTSLKAALGETEDDFNALMKEMIRANFVTIKGNDIRPTARFRKGMAACKRADWKVDRICYEQNGVDILI